MQRALVQQVRSFNRLVTRRIGALDDSYLARGRPLGEARLIFEVGSAGGMDLSALRARLGLDSGYLSRLLRSLEGEGLVEVSRKAEDGRARVVVLTAKGREEFAAYDMLSDRLAESILAPLGAEQRERLAAAMAEVERLMRASAVTVEVEPAESADARWSLEQYYAELARRFDNGFDAALGANFNPADMTPPKGWFVLARLDGEPVGCGALKRLEPGVGEIKRVWTASAARGMGVASRLMDRLEAIAGENDLATLRLDTNGALVEAQAMYRKRGYREIARYNDNPYAQHWFEKGL